MPFDADVDDDDAGADWSMLVLCPFSALAVVLHVPWRKEDAGAEEVKRKGQA